MSSATPPGTRGRRSPTAECRLCSVALDIDAPTPDDLRRGLRAFMAEHRHNGVADIVIDLGDDDDGGTEAEGPQSPATLSSL